MLAHTPPMSLFNSHTSFPFPGPPPLVSQSEIYLRDLEQERGDVLTFFYANKSHTGSCKAASHLGWSGPIQPSHYDDRGRQVDFKETVRQRQERLEFLRRQEFARRLALKGLSSPAESSYVIKRLPPPLRRATPAERTRAATKIQRAFRFHMMRRQALADITSITSVLEDLRQSFTQVHTSRASARSGSSLRYDLSVREYDDHLALLAVEVEEIMGDGDYVVRNAARALASDLKSEIRQLEDKKLELWVQELKDAHREVLTVIEEEICTEVERASPTPTSPSHLPLSQDVIVSRRSPHRSLSRPPSLESIREDDAESRE